MTITATVLLEAKLVEATATTQISSTNVTTIIDKFTVYNGDTGAQSLILYVVPPNGTPVNGNVLLLKSLQSAEAYTCPELVGHVLAKGGSVAAYASKAGVLSIRASGRLLT